MLTKQPRKQVLCLTDGLVGAKHAWTDQVAPAQPEQPLRDREPGAYHFPTDDRLENAFASAFGDHRRRTDSGRLVSGVELGDHAAQAKPARARAGLLAVLGSHLLDILVALSCRRARLRIVEPIHVREQNQQQIY